MSIFTLMSKPPRKIQFVNQQNPAAAFDYLRLEELFRKRLLDHSIDKQHQVDFYILYFVEEGQGYHTIDFTDYKCTRGTLLTIRKDQIHQFFISDNLKGSLLLFTDDFLVSYLEKVEARKTLLLFNELLGIPKLQLGKSDFENIRQIISRIEEEYLAVNDDHSLGIIRSELHILISHLFRIKSKSAPINTNKKHLPMFIDFQNMVENSVSKTTKVQDFARRLGVSTKTLNTITKNFVHKTAKQFIDEICTKQIKRLLINSNLPIKEIAFQSGFEEDTNFYKYFKRQTGTTPEQFRAAY